MASSFCTVISVPILCVFSVCWDMIGPCFILLAPACIRACRALGCLLSVVMLVWFPEDVGFAPCTKPEFCSWQRLPWAVDLRGCPQQRWAHELLLIFPEVPRFTYCHGRAISWRVTTSSLSVTTHEVLAFLKIGHQFLISEYSIFIVTS